MVTDPPSDLSALKANILKLTKEYSRLKHASFRPSNDSGRSPWKTGDSVPYAGRVFTEEEVAAAIELLKSNLNAFRVVRSLEGANKIMKSTIFLGTYPGLTSNMLDWEIKAISNFINSKIQ